MNRSEKRALRIMLACWLLMVLMGMTYTALAQDEATPEGTPEIIIVDTPADTGVTVNIEQPPAPTAETTNAQSIFALVVLIVGAILGGGTIWVISPRIRTNIEHDPAVMDSIERKYFSGNAATRDFINKAAAEARGWLDFQQKISDGVLNDGTRLE